MLGGMFRRVSHRKFEYRPRYYDPFKEELEQRFKSREITHVDDREARRMRIADGMRRNQGHSNIRKESTLRSNILIISIAAVLVLMAFLLLGDVGFWKQ